MDNKLARQLFDRWKTSLSKKSSSEKGTAYVQTNFEELFYELSTNLVDFESANSILSEAVSAHMPPIIVAERVWQLHKSKYSGINKVEFMSSWRSSIEDAAKTAFYAWYQIPGEKEEKKIEGSSMSPQEYSLQRKYANSFSPITIEELQVLDEKRRRFLEENEQDLFLNL